MIKFSKQLSLEKTREEDILLKELEALRFASVYLIFVAREALDQSKGLRVQNHG